MIPEFDMSDEKIIDTNKIVDKLKQAKLPIFIWGYAVTAAVVNEKLQSLGVNVTGFVTDKLGVTSMENVGATRNYRVIPKETLIDKYSNYILIKGFADSFKFTDAEVKKMWSGCEEVYTVSDVHDGGYIEDISREFYLDNKSAFDDVYDNLADELSRKSLRAYLMARILKNPSYVVPYVITPQYFFIPAIWQASDSDVYLDGGAFDGDSALDFVNFTGGKYKKIIACEPDPANFKALQENLNARGVKNFVALNVGLGDKENTLKFNTDLGMSANYSSRGTMEIPITTIDTIEKDMGGVFL